MLGRRKESCPAVSEIRKKTMETDKKNSDKTELRRRAEKKFEMEARNNKEFAEMSPEKISNQIYDLQVHQIELKMQNDERRRIHKELEESRDRYSHLYDFAPNGYFTLTEKGLIDGANLTLSSMLGVVRADLLGKSFNRFVQKEDQDIFYKHCQKIMETETSHTCELKLVEKDGHEIYVRLEAIVIQNEKGQKQIRGAVSDITDLKRSEKDLLRSEAKYSSMDEAHEFAENIINTVREPLIALDQDLRVVTVNRSFYNFFRVKPEETMGQFIYDLGNKQWDIPKLRELLETILPQKISFDDYEVEHHFPNIGNCKMLLNARQIQRALGKDQIILLAMEDITERKIAEDLLLEKKKFQGVLEMAGAICHELNQPLQIVSGYSEILLNDMEISNPKYKALKGIEDGIKRIGLLMRKIMGITHYQSKPYLKREIIDIEKASQDEKGRG